MGLPSAQKWGQNAKMPSTKILGLSRRPPWPVFATLRLHQRAIVSCRTAPMSCRDGSKCSALCFRHIKHLHMAWGHMVSNCESVFEPKCVEFTSLTSNCQKSSLGCLTSILTGGGEGEGEAGRSESSRQAATAARRVARWVPAVQSLSSMFRPPRPTPPTGRSCHKSSV